MKMATSNSEAEPTATSLREEGNAFYNSGKLLEGKFCLSSVALDQPVDYIQPVTNTQKLKSLRLKILYPLATSPLRSTS